MKPQVERTCAELGVRSKLLGVVFCCMLAVAAATACAMAFPSLTGSTLHAQLPQLCGELFAASMAPGLWMGFSIDADDQALEAAQKAATQEQA
jgi:hypothetical protein